MHVDYSEHPSTSICKFGTTRSNRDEERHRREQGRCNPIPIQSSVVLLFIEHTENEGSPGGLHVGPADYPSHLYMIQIASEMGQS